jgi:hypothetical protein
MFRIVLQQHPVNFDLAIYAELTRTPAMQARLAAARRNPTWAQPL